jgi:RNA polymerase sigma-70 factor (ECF subfamily)
MFATPTDDTALTLAAKDGDLAAFEVLVRAHTSEVFAHALRFFGERSAAEDATQEVWIKVYRALSSFDERSRFSTWLYRVTRNTCLDQLRAGKHRPIPVDVLDDPIQEDFSDEVALRATLEHAMRALAPDDRDALSAISLFGLTYAEASAELGVPAGTVKSRVFRARRALAHALAPLGGE